MYADSGGGKTRFCGTAEKPYAAYTDSNLLSIEVTGMPYTPIRSWNDLVGLRGDITAAMQEGTYPYKTVCLDTITATDLLVFKHQLNRTFVELKEWGTKIIPIWRDEIMKWLELANPKAYEHPVDVILTSRIEYFTPKEGPRYASVSVPGFKLAAELFAWVDLVLHGAVETGIDEKNQSYHSYKLYTARHEMDGMNFLAKDGSGCLDYAEDPDFAAIKRKITSKLTKMGK
jgi:hypothetical protein